MIAVRFEVNDRKLEPGGIHDAAMVSALEETHAYFSQRLGAIRDPDTGEFPTVMVRGDSLDKRRRCKAL